MSSTLSPQTLYPAPGAPYIGTPYHAIGPHTPAHTFHLKRDLNSRPIIWREGYHMRNRNGTLINGRCTHPGAFNSFSILPSLSSQQNQSHSSPHTFPIPPFQTLSLSLSLSMSMATTSLQSLHQSFLHHHQHHHHHHHHLLPSTQFQIDYPPFFFKPITTTTTTHSKLFSNLSSSPSISTTAAAAAASSSSSLDLLARHLSSSDFRRADDETRRLLIALAGEAAQKRGYVFFSEVQFISADDLRAIDRLWRAHSGGRFGYGVQRRIWERKARRDFTRFFIRVGWMRRLDTEVEQYNYCSFPDEFVWELNDGTPEGHLPLTNALRGTQLLASILTHPAFDESEEAAAAEEESEEDGAEKMRERPTTVMRDFKPDYSF